MFVNLARRRRSRAAGGNADRSPAGPSKAYFWKALRTRAKYGMSMVHLFWPVLLQCDGVVENQKANWGTDRSVL